MARFKISANMEFVRSADLSFEAGIKVAAELGYRWVEPMVHTGYELLSEVGYFHSFSMEEDPALMVELLEKAGVRASSISAHSPLMKPEAAVSRLTRALVLADYVDAPFLNSDEMLKPEWMSDEVAHDVMRYTLTRVLHAAARHRKYICIEPHGVFTKDSAGLLRIVDLVDSPWVAVNWDTGNAYLAGVEDPYEGLERALPFIRHVHAKDISMAQADVDRGKVTGTPVGCACGEGVVDWDRVIRTLNRLDRDITLSVECGTVDEAERSRPFLEDAVRKAGAELITE